MQQKFHPQFSCCVAGSFPTGAKLYAQINLPFTTKQYKNDNIVNFVQFRENLTLVGSFSKPEKCILNT